MLWIICELVYTFFIFFHRMAPEMAAVERLGGYDLKVCDVIIISNPRDSVSSHFQTSRRELKIRLVAAYF